MEIQIPEKNHEELVQIRWVLEKILVELKLQTATLKKDRK